MTAASLIEAPYSRETPLGYLTTPEVPFAAPTCLPAARLNEGADDYPLIIARLNDRWRVIDFRCGLQWILQRRPGQREGTARWEGHAYCRTRDGLLSNIREQCGEITEAGLRAIERLPERHA